MENHTARIKTHIVVLAWDIVSLSTVVFKDPIVIPTEKNTVLLKDASIRKQENNAKLSLSHIHTNKHISPIACPFCIINQKSCGF